VPIEVKPEGGVYTFVGNFLRWLTRHDWPHTADLQSDFDLLFVNSWVIRPSVVRRLKRLKPMLKVAHRIDGAAADYGSNPASDRIQARVNLLADVSIFQSEYSKYSTREKFTVVAQDGPVIYNPVDIEQFAPGGVRRELPTGRPLVACASWSVNRGKGTWRIDELAARHQDVVFVLCGRFDAVQARPNVVRMGHLTREGMAETLRACDVFLNLSENDPCPNVVIEALASGLPILYKSSGGVPELVGDCGLPIDRSTFRAALERMQSCLPEWKRRARERAVGCFAPDRIFPAYLDVMAGARRRPLPTAGDVWRLARAGYPVWPRLSVKALLAWARRP